MFDFRLLKKSKRSRARLGILKTSHGEVETPAIVPVATQATIKSLTTDQVAATGSQLLICNTFHLHLKPGERIVKKHGGLHKFMHWKKPLMTDSGGFQVFSLGFGRDLGVNKVAKQSGTEAVSVHAQPKHVRLTPNGVYFRSPVDGRELFLSPKESIRIQEALGADIIFAFDECPPPGASKAYVAKSLLLTHDWAKRSLKAHKTRQALYGIVQGGRFKDLRIASARIIGAMNFPGFGIGGEFGAEKKIMEKMLGWVNDVLPAGKPRHLLGIGYPDDLALVMRAGIDTFDCTVPTHMARRGIAYVRGGTHDLRKQSFLEDKKPIDPDCDCFTCSNHARGYLTHLLRAQEFSAYSLITIHNLTHFNRLVAELRVQIKRGKL